MNPLKPPVGPPRIGYGPRFMSTVVVSHAMRIDARTPDELRAELVALSTSNRRQREYISDLERQVRELRERIPRGCVDAIARAGGVARRYEREGEAS
jgi:hypothetical protein